MAGWARKVLRVVSGGHCISDTHVSMIGSRKGTQIAEQYFTIKYMYFMSRMLSFVLFGVRQAGMLV